MAAFKILGAPNQVWLQLPIAIALSVGLFAAWILSLRVLGLRRLQLVGSKELGACLALSMVWAPLVFVPLHYFTQGYLTAIGNLIALALYQFPVNALALFGTSVLSNWTTDGSAPKAARTGSRSPVAPWRIRPEALTVNRGLRPLG